MKINVAAGMLHDTAKEGGMARLVATSVRIAKLVPAPLLPVRNLAALDDGGGALPPNGAFKVSVAMDPMVLGADLYRLDVELRDETGVCDVLGRAFEVIDEEGQVGGKPLLYYPSTISVRAETGAGQ